MKAFLTLCLLVALTPLRAAYTYNLTSLSQDAFEECYYAGKVNGVFVKKVEAGDTIVLPAGQATWGDPSRFNSGIIYIILPITVRGQGDSTVITLHEGAGTYTRGVIALWSSATFADLKIVGADTRPVTAFSVGIYNNTAPGGVNFTGGFRITNITYDGRRGAAYFAYLGPGVNSGLIDHCRIGAAVGNAELLMARGPGNAWQLDNTLGKAENIFVEDCEFYGGGYVNDANSNARMVVRFCVISGPVKVDGHGLASNTPARGYRNMEVYHNRWTHSAVSNWAAVEMRGGTFMIFNNQSSIRAWFYLTDYGYLNLWPNFGQVYQTPVNYPITDQVGVGKDPKRAGSEPAYIWNNKVNGAPWPRTLKGIPQGAIDLYRTQTGNPTAGFSEQDMVRANRDFFADEGFDNAAGVSSGTKAQMLAFQPGFVGYGWWVTDEGEWNNTNGATPDGQLYVWDGAAWTLKYRPFTYPHPLRTSGAPQNVRINVRVN